MIKLSLKLLFGNRKKNMITALGIACSVMLMFSLMQMGNCIKYSFKGLVENIVNSDFTVHNLSRENVESIEKNIIEEKKVNAYLKRMLVGEVYNNMETSQLIGIEGGCNKFLGSYLIKGELPQKLYEICLYDDYIESLDKKYSVGDDIYISVLDMNGREHNIKFSISGVLNSVYNSTDSNELYITYKTAIDICSRVNFNLSEDISFELIVDHNKYDVDENIKLINEIRNLFDNPDKFYANHIVNNEAKETLFTDKGVYYGLSYGIMSLSILVLVCSIVFIFNIVYVNYIDRIKQYGIMRCIGMNNFQLMQILFNEVMICNIIGLLIGLILGNVLNSFIGEKILFNIMLDDYRIPFEIQQYAKDYIVVSILSLLATLIAYLIVAIKIKKISPIKTLNYNENTVIKGKHRSKIDINRYGLLFSMAKTNIMRNKVKTCTLGISLILSSILVLLLFNIGISIDYEYGTGKEQIADIEVNSNFMEWEYFENRDITELISSNMIEAIYRIRFERGYINKDKVNSARLVIYDNDLFEKLISMNKNLKKLDFKNNDVAVAYVPENMEYDNKYMDFYATDELLTMYKSAKEKYTICIEGKVDDKSLLSDYLVNLDQEMYVIINENLAERLYNDDFSYTTLLIKAKDNCKIKASDIKKYINKNVNYSVVKRRMSDTYRQIISIMSLAAYILLTTFFVSMFIIYFNIKSNNIIRCREYGIMRALGITYCDLIKLVSYENGLIASVSSLIAYPMSIFISYVMLENLGLQIKMKLIYIDVIVLLFIILICILISRRAMKNSEKKIIEMIYEE